MYKCFFAKKKDTKIRNKIENDNKLQHALLIILLLSSQTILRDVAIYKLQEDDPYPFVSVVLPVVVTTNAGAAAKILLLHGTHKNSISCIWIHFVHIQHNIQLEIAANNYKSYANKYE